MQPPWHALHAHLRQTISTHRFQCQFETLRSDPALRRFSDPAALLDHLHVGPGDPHDRNVILLALVGAARSGRDEAAVPVLLLALWPGLDAVYRRLLRYYRGESDELAADLLDRMLGGIHRLDPSRVTWVAATLLRNVERDIRRSLFARLRREAWTEPLVPDVVRLAPQPPSQLGIPAALDADTARALLHDRLAPTLGGDAGLILAVAVDGRTQQEAGERLCLGPEAARKRYQRGLGRLRDVLA